MGRQMSVVRRMEHICGRSDTKGSRQQTPGLRNRNRKTDSVILSGIGIRVLSKDNYFYFFEGTGIEYMKNLMSEREDVYPFIFIFDECNQLIEVWFIKFFL